MWYTKFSFFDKQEGLENIPEDFFLSPVTDDEFGRIAKYAAPKSKDEFPIPLNLKLPTEFIQLLNYSNGGGIINGEREFGYFDLETIREMYISYGFLIWAPDVLPIAFNGGGMFYAYDLSSGAGNPPIYLVPSGCVGDEDNCVVLGYSLEEVLDKTTNVEDELDARYQ